MKVDIQEGMDIFSKLVVNLSDRVKVLEELSLEDFRTDCRIIKLLYEQEERITSLEKGAARDH